MNVSIIGWCRGTRARRLPKVLHRQRAGRPAAGGAAVFAATHEWIAVADGRPIDGARGSSGRLRDPQGYLRDLARASAMNG